MNEPGTAVPEEYAHSKANFNDLVRNITTGDEGIATPSPEEYLEDFKKLFKDHSEYYPDTRPAAVSEEELDFHFMEKDREHFQENMAAYLEQFPQGCPPVDGAVLDAVFSTEQYEIYRQKFWKQTSGVISGDDTPFDAPHVLHQQLVAPEKLEHETYPGTNEPDFPFSFSILNQMFPVGSELPQGGPVVGAIICTTAPLQKAVAAIAAAPTKRGKGEALQFLTRAERCALYGARNVAVQAEKVGAPVLVIGDYTLTGYQPVEITDVDVRAALLAMDIDDNGKSRLNYFVQAYRANDHPFYSDYAVFRASEVLAGPRQIIVTK